MTRKNLLLSKLMLPLLALLALAACERSAAKRMASMAPPIEASISEAPSRASATGVSTRSAIVAQRRSMLAYEHAVTVELDEKLISPRLDAVQTACAASTQYACELLDVSTNTLQGTPSGTLRLRTSADGIGYFIKLAAEGGKIIAKSTHAEDLAQPLQDSARQLSQLSAQRDQLGAFLNGRDLKVDQVIALTREVSQLQAQIEEIENSRGDLQRRTQTELLTLNLNAPSLSAAEHASPVVDALRSIGVQFSAALANVILFIATLIPWLIVLIPGVVLLRIFWRWIGRRIEVRSR